MIGPCDDEQRAIHGRLSRPRKPATMAGRRGATLRDDICVGTTVMASVQAPNAKPLRRYEFPTESETVESDRLA